MRNVNPTRFSLRILLAIYLLVIGQTSYAEPTDAPTDTNNTRYVIDRLYISARESTKEGAAAISRGIASGTRLKLISEDKESGYSLIETGKGVQGWVKSRYLQKKPTAELKLAQLEGKLKLPPQQTDGKLLEENKALKKENRNLSKTNSRLEKELKEIKHASANIIKISKQNRMLIEKNQLLQSKVDSLEAIGDQYRDDKTTTFFIYGVITVIGTIIMMLIYDGMKRRRSYGGDW